MFIYRIQNILTGDFYIGQTIHPITDRFARHKNDCKKKRFNSHLHNSMRKYGEEYFIIGTIEECNSLTELNEKEIFWIDNLKPTLNIQNGGKNLGKHSISSIQKMSDSAKSRWKRYTKEKKLEISNNYKKSKQTEQYKNLDVWKNQIKEKGVKICITNIETQENIIFDSIRECERNGWSRATIQRCISNNKIFTRKIDSKKYTVKKQYN
jgi:group I intron endonuclease